MAKDPLTQHAGPRGRRARLVALCVSLALHALLAVLFWQMPPAQLSVSPGSEPMEIEILAEAPPAETPVVDPPPDPGDRRPAAPTRSSRGRSRQSASPSTPAAPSGPTGEIREDAGGLRMRFPPPKLALGPSYEDIDRLTRDGVIAPPDPRVAPAEKPRGPTFSERLAERVRNDGARANVESGKVHPQIYDFLRDARRGFTPDEGALDRDPRAPNTVARSLRQWGRGVAEARKSWVRKLTDPPPRHLEHEPDRRGAPDILKHYNRMMNGTETAAEPMDCLVCLVIRPGAEPEVVLKGSSGNPEVDRAAVESLRRSANTRPLDRDVQAQQSCFRFRATVHRIPPIPIVGCGFDEASLTAGCYYPTMKVRKTSVHLESVDYDG